MTFVEVIDFVARCLEGAGVAVAGQPAGRHHPGHPQLDRLAVQVEGDPVAGPGAEDAGQLVVEDHLAG